MLVDSHCHLNFPELKADLDGVVERARAAGVGVMQTICTEMAEFDEIYAITERYEGVYCSVGVHPNDSGKAELVNVEDLVEKTKLPNVIGIGETGLDYHYEHTDRSFQQESFRRHIEAARITGLPLIVHSRDADEDTVNILNDEYQKGKFSGLIHCFTSTEYLAKKSIEIGFYISFSGIVSFKNAESIRSTLKIIPNNMILIETDAPFLAPVPHRGKANEPAFVRYTNKSVADTLKMDEDVVAALTTNNFFNLFSKAKRL
jgi:TatD DNase family protein